VSAGFIADEVGTESRDIAVSEMVAGPGAHSRNCCSRFGTSK
jgi:hypothetical protein